MGLNVRHISGPTKEAVKSEITKFLQKYGYTLVDATYEESPWDEGMGWTAMITYTK